MYELLTLLLSVCTGIAGYLLGRAAKLNGYEKRIKELEADYKSKEKDLEELRNTHLDLSSSVSSFINRFCYDDITINFYHKDTFTCNALKDLIKVSYYQNKERLKRLLDEQIFKNKVRDEMRKHLCDDDDDVTESDVERVLKNIRE